MRILVLTSSTGGGHDMRANALKAWVHQLKPDWKVHIHQALEDTHLLYSFGVGLYNFIQRTYPPLHHIYYNFLEFAGLLSKGKSILGQSRFIALLEEFQPDVIFSVHDSTNHGFFHIAKQVLGAKKVKCITYCSEMHGGYGMSRYWVNPQADLIIGSLPETVDAVIKMGMPAKQVKLGGFLLHPSFYEPLPIPELTRFWEEELTLDRKQLTLILSTGANSANHHLSFLNGLSQLTVPIQIIALCGNDNHSQKRILSHANQLPPNIAVRALPKTDKVSWLMQGASGVVGRPGAGISHEALQMECPLIINKLTPLMPQEMINERFAVKHHIAYAVKNPFQLSQVITRWHKTPDEYTHLKNKIRALKPQLHPRDILSLMDI